MLDPDAIILQALQAADTEMRRPGAQSLAVLAAEHKLINDQLELHQRTRTAAEQSTAEVIEALHQWRMEFRARRPGKL